MALNSEIIKENVVVFSYVKITNFKMTKVTIIKRQVTNVFSKEITHICPKMRNQPTHPSVTD